MGEGARAGSVASGFLPDDGTQAVRRFWLVISLGLLFGSVFSTLWVSNAKLERAPILLRTGLIGCGLAALIALGLVAVYASDRP